MSKSNKYGMVVTSVGGWNHVGTYANRAELSTGWKSSREIHKAAKMIAQWGSSRPCHTILVCKKIKRKGWKIITQIDIELIA